MDGAAFPSIEGPIVITIEVPVVDKIILVDVYINVDVQLMTKSRMDDTRHTLAIDLLRQKLNGAIYSSVKLAMEDMTKAGGR